MLGPRFFSVGPFMKIRSPSSSLGYFYNKKSDIRGGCLTPTYLSLKISPFKRSFCSQDNNLFWEEKVKFPTLFKPNNEIEMHFLVSTMEYESFRKLEFFNPEEYGLKLNEDEKRIHNALEKIKKAQLEEQQESGLSLEQFLKEKIETKPQFDELMKAFDEGEEEKFEELADNIFHPQIKRTEEEQKHWDLMLKLADPELQDYLTDRATFEGFDIIPDKWSKNDVDDAAERALLGDNPTEKELLEYEKRKFKRMFEAEPYMFSYRARELEKTADKYERARKKKAILLDQIARGLFRERQLVTLMLEHEIEVNSSKVGSFMLLEKKDMKKWIPEGISGDMAEEIQYVHRGEKVCFLVRPETVKVVNYLEQARQAGFVDQKNYTLLHGDAGSGKSTLLNEVVIWARKGGWLVLFIPDGHYWVNGEQLIDESVREDFVYDQQSIANPWCKALLQAHKDKLSTIKLKLSTTDLPGFDRTPTSTLADLVEYGAKTDRLSTDVVYHLRREINLVTEYPVLVVVDGINNFYHKTVYFNPNTTHPFIPESLQPEQLVLARSFMNYQNHGLANGVFVTTTNARLKSSMVSYKKKMPIDGQRVLNVPVMRKPEFDQWMLYLEQFGAFLHHVPGGQRAMIYHMCAGRGNDAFKYIQHSLM